MIVDDLRKISEEMISSAYDFEDNPTAIKKAQTLSLIERLEKVQQRYKNKIQNIMFGGK